MPLTEISPVTCRAKVIMRTVSAGEVSCKGIVELTDKEVRFRLKPLLGNEELTVIPWDIVRELKMGVGGPPQFFSADFGGRESNARFSAYFIEGDWQAIQNFLMSLPESTRQKKCPSCGGPVHENVCATCGKDYRKTQMKHSLAAIAAGIILGGTGLFLATSSNDPWYVGMCVLGVIICGMGLVNAGRLFTQR